MTKKCKSLFVRDLLCEKLRKTLRDAFCFFKYLDCLWAQVQKLKKDRWQERHIPRPYLAFDNVLCEALQHNLPPFTPPPHTEDSVYPMPRVIFRMFDYTDDPEVSVKSKSKACLHFNLRGTPSKVFQASKYFILRGFKYCTRLHQELSAYKGYADGSHFLLIEPFDGINASITVIRSE